VCGGGDQKSVLSKQEMVLKKFHIMGEKKLKKTFSPLKKRKKEGKLSKPGGEKGERSHYCLGKEGSL